MKVLAIATLILGIFVTPLYAQAQKPVEFNGMVWRELRARGASRVPASIALSKRRSRTRAPVALVRSAHVRTRNWQTISASK
jgi:hypothetical protein